MSVDYVKANPDIVQESKDLVLTQFGESDNIQKFVEIIAEEAKTYEEVAEKIFTSFLLINATGFALDSIGEFLNFSREGRGDDAYRTALVISAIGANSSITRDSIYRLVEIVTGGLGGYFYNGRYHDLYIYLQDACVERTIAAEFLDKYLPANTQASVLFESGESWGFENNDRAKGFSKVYQQAAEGDAYVKLSESVVSSDIAPVLPRAFEFLGNDTYTYRTEFEADLSQRVRAISWTVPDTYLVGDVITITARNNSTRELFQDSLTLTSSGTGAYLEIIPFVSDFFVNNGIVELVNVVTDSPSVYIGIESGLTPPISDPRIVGFDNDYTIIFDAKDKSGLDYYSRVSLINKTLGEIPVAWGMSFEPSDAPTFTIESTQAGNQFFSGFGETGVVIPDEPFEEAGGFCTRVSLTSIDILGYGTLQEPESFEYNLDSKLSEVVGVLTSSGDLVQPRLVGEYNKFSPQPWDNTFSGSTYGNVFRSPSGIIALSNFQTNLLTSIDSISEPYELRSSDISLPNSPYYYEIDFEKLPNSDAILLSKHWQISTVDKVTRNINTDGDEILEKLSTGAYLTVFVEYSSGLSQFDLKLNLMHSGVLKRINNTTDTTIEEFVYDGESDNTLLSYSDATLESPKNIGILYNPITNLYTVYVDGVEFDGVDGIPEFTSVDPLDTSGATIGDLYKPSPYYDNGAFFRLEFQVDNTTSEPSTEDDYGTLEFIYNRDDLKYTSQLPLNTVDIFGRKIN